MISLSANDLSTVAVAKVEVGGEGRREVELPLSGRFATPSPRAALRGEGNKF